MSRLDKEPSNVTMYFVVALVLLIPIVIAFTVY